MPLRSMTGFARVRRSGALGEIVLTLKTVNHRSLDIHAHLGAELEPFESALRTTIRQRVGRGHLDLRISFAPTVPLEQARLNVAYLQSYVAAFRRAQQETGIAGEPDLNAALRLPGMLSLSEDADPPAAIETELLSVLGEALDALDTFREREGAGIVRAMQTSAEAITAAAEEMELLREGALAAFRARLNERLGELLRGAPVEPQRLVQEAALLADRSDIAEELARLKVHASEVLEILAGHGEAGKKLDFLLQEMNREANTVLSKSSGVADLGLRITELALSAKGNIERIREQALNLE